MVQLPTSFKNDAVMNDPQMSCQPCPGVSESQWLDSNAQYTVCGGIFRGRCKRVNTGLPASVDPIEQIWELKCECNEGFQGSVCRCVDRLEKSFINEQTDYGCFGRGTCGEMEKYEVDLHKKEEKCISTNHTIEKNYYEAIQECNKICYQSSFFSVDDHTSGKTSFICNCCNSTANKVGFNTFFTKVNTTKMYCIPDKGSHSMFIEPEAKLVVPFFSQQKDLHLKPASSHEIKSL